jgi:hypothetical protein
MISALSIHLATFHNKGWVSPRKPYLLHFSNSIAIQLLKRMSSRALQRSARRPRPRNC